MMRTLIGVVLLAVLLFVLTPAHAEKLRLRLQAGQLVGVAVGTTVLPATGIGGFYVRPYTLKTPAVPLTNSDFSKLPRPLPDGFQLDETQRWKEKPTLLVALPEDKDADSGEFILRAAVQPGRTYLLRYAHKSDRVGGEMPPILHFRQLDAAGSFVLGQNNVELPGGTYDWKEETQAICIADGVSTLEVMFHHPGGRGRCWLSEPSLSEVTDQPTVPVPGMWDVGKDGALAFTGRIPGTDVTLVAKAREGEDAIGFETALAAPSAWLAQHPTALVLSFRLPVNATGWKWGDYARGERTIEAGRDYRYDHLVGMRQMRLASWFPMAALSGPAQGLALTVPMVPTTLHRLSYSRRGSLDLDFDLGLASRVEKPGPGVTEATRLSFDLLRYDPAWGYRAALAAYYARYPQFFASTAKEGGWWIGPSDRVKDLTDFGMQYSENHFAHAEDVKANNGFGIYSCSYCEPWMWRVEAKWIEADQIQTTKPLSYYLAELDKQADLPPTERDDGDYWPGTRRESVRAFLNSAIYGPDGKIAVNAVRTYGAPAIEFSTSSLPTIRSDRWGDDNRGLLSYKLETLEDAKRCAAGGAKLDGVYFDSVGDWSDIAAEDHRVEHQRFAAYPLTFSYATGKPVISGLAAMGEYMKFIRDHNYITMANSDAKYAAYAAPYLDFIGAGEGFYGDDTTDAAFMHDRAVAYHKSLGFLNTDMTRLSPEEAGKRFRFLLFYHIYPGLAVGDPEPLEKARPVFQKYVPLMRAMGAAGWEPVTFAAADDPVIRVERFGPTKGGTVYFALRNPGAEKKTVMLAVDSNAFGRMPRTMSSATEAVTGAALAAEPAAGKLRVSLDVPGGDTAVVRLDFTP